MERHLIQLPIPRDYTSTVQLVLCQQNFDFKKSPWCPSSKRLPMALIFHVSKKVNDNPAFKPPLNRGEFHPRQIFHVLCTPAKHKEVSSNEQYGLKSTLTTVVREETSAVSWLLV